MFEEHRVMCKSARLIMAMMERAVYTAVYTTVNTVYKLITKNTIESRLR